LAPWKEINHVIFKVKKALRIGMGQSEGKQGKLKIRELCIYQKFTE
jgi:hypothetical protein